MRKEVSEQEIVLRRSEKYTEEAVFPQRVAWFKQGRRAVMLCLGRGVP